MGVCERCTENGNCAWQNHDETICREKAAFPITNADRIRAMTDEELAHLLHSAEEHLFTGNLWNYEKWTAWLKQEATDG